MDFTFPSFYVKREDQERPKMEEHANFTCHRGNTSSEYICLGADCFVCERAAMQVLPENSNWKKKVQRSVNAYQTNRSPVQSPYGCFSVESLQQLQPAESEKTKPFYVYDEKLGRKRRHDPWFAKHTITRDEQPRTDRRRKRTKLDRKDTNLQTPSIFMKIEPCEHSLRSSQLCMNKELSCSNENFNSPCSSFSSLSLDSPVQTTFDVSDMNSVMAHTLNQFDYFPNAHQDINNGNSCDNQNDASYISKFDDITKCDSNSNLVDNNIGEWIMGVLDANVPE